MLLLEHPPMYTRGRRSGAGELPMGEDWYRMQGFEIVDVNRGGKITYHGPGSWSAIRSCASTTSSPISGRWSEGSSPPSRRRGDRARARAEDGPTTPACGSASARSPPSGSTSPRGVTTHGFAVNVENDLQPFSWMVACGLPEVQMTSLIRETGRLAGQMPCFRKRVAFAVARRWAAPAAASRERLEAALGAPTLTLA